MDISWNDGVAVLTIDRGVNAFDATFVDELHGALDIVDASESVQALVTTGADKHYSNGFDIDFLSSLEGPALRSFMDASVTLLGRLLAFPVPTVAALNGHAFGIGAMLALAHDRRVMRPDRGWFCLPEIDLGMQFSPFMLALVTHALPTTVAEHAILTGRRWGGDDARAAGIAHATAPAEELVDAAIAEAGPMTGKGRDITVALKRALRASVLEHLPTDPHGTGG